MAAHKTNPLLKYALIPVVGLIILIVVLSVSSHERAPTVSATDDKKIANTASKDSAKESLDTLTASLSETQQNVQNVMKDNESLKAQNATLLSQLQNKKDEKTESLSQEVSHLQSQLQNLNTRPPDNSKTTLNDGDAAQPITRVPEVAAVLDPKSAAKNSLVGMPTESISTDTKKQPAIPFYTIPANATSVEDRLMTALVGRIPIKGVVTDPYPFKLVFSDDTLAANGLRVPNLRQMIVSGYTEGDLNLVSVRGWVTSLTFVFNDGTISTTTSNENNIGKFTKDDALGYLSDKYGNPFIRGKLITNAPTYLTMDVALGAAQGAASAYAQSQTTTNSTIVGTTTSTVTGSPGAYVAGQAANNAANQVEQWWHDREQQSFDAVYVPTVDEKTQEPIFIAVNFAKEIHIDYDPQGRKIMYTGTRPASVTKNLD